MPASISFSTDAAVSTSLALARISPVSVLTTSCASTLPYTYSRGTRSRVTLASSSWRTWRAVMRRPSSTITWSPMRISKVAVSPRRRCGTSCSATSSRPMKKVLVSKNVVEDLRLVHAERAQDDRHRQLAAAVDAREHAVLRVELEVEPRAAVGNDARGEQQLAGGVRLAAVVVEEHARASGAAARR